MPLAPTRVSADAVPPPAATLEVDSLVRQRSEWKEELRKTVLSALDLKHVVVKRGLELKAVSGSLGPDAYNGVDPTPWISTTPVDKAVYGMFNTLEVLGITDFEIMSETQKPSSDGAYFVLPSQLNRAEYPSCHTTVTKLQDYMVDTTGTDATDDILGAGSKFKLLVEGYSRMPSLLFGISPMAAPAFRPRKSSRPSPEIVEEAYSHQKQSILHAISSSLQNLALSGTFPGLDVMLSTLMARHGLVENAAGVAKCFLLSLMLDSPTMDDKLQAGNFFLASCPEHLLDDAKKLMLESGGENTAGQRKDKFHTEVLKLSKSYVIKIIAWMASTQDNWFTAWKGKTEQAFQMLSKAGQKKVTAFAVKGGPQCDRERVYLHKLASMPEYKCLTVVEVDNLDELKAELCCLRK